MLDPGRCLHSFRKLRDFAAKGCWEAQVSWEPAWSQCLLSGTWGGAARLPRGAGGSCQGNSEGGQL